MRILVLFIFLSYAGSGYSDSITLFNADGKKTKPWDLSLDTSWIGVATIGEGGGAVSCTATHVNPETAVLHQKCLGKNVAGKALKLYFWDKTGKQRNIEIPRENVQGNTEGSIQLIKLPKDVADQWAVAGDTERKSELWFGGFHPKWDLVRVYTMEKGQDDKSFHFQVNTCKASTRSPSLKRVTAPSEEDDEDVLSETDIIPRDSEFRSYLVIEKCIRPFTDSSQGGIITLAKDFSQKIGFLTQITFQGIPQRELAALVSPPKFQDGTLLRYIGSDEMEGALPKNPAAIELQLSFPIGRLFPKKQ